MEVAVAEEKKKIFRARKTMKVSDRQQLETLHNTLSASGLSSNSSSPLGPLLNGTHKEEGRKGSPDKELNEADPKSPGSTTPMSPSPRGSRCSPALSLSLKLSPSPPPNHSPTHNDDDTGGAAAATSSPASPFHSLNFELKKMEEEGKRVCSPPPSNGCPASPLKGDRNDPTEATNQTKKDESMEIQKEETNTKNKDLVSDSVNDSQPSPHPSSASSDKKSDKDEESKQEDAVAMETDPENSKPETSEASTLKVDETSSRKPTSASCRSPPPHPPSSSSSSSSSSIPVNDHEIKEEKKDIKGVKNEKELKDIKLKSSKEQMDVDAVKSDLKKEDVGSDDSKASRPSSTPPCGLVKEEKRSATGLKRTLSEGDEKGETKVERDGKRPKVRGVELEAQLELKITAKPGSRLKLEKVVQQMVADRLKELQLTFFDQSYQELKDRVEKIDCANKHQNTLVMLQAKVARLAKKFGEANQASENKKNQQVITITNPVAKTTAAPTTAAPPLRLVRTSSELKQMPATTVSTCQAAVLSSQAQPKHALPSTVTSSAALVTQNNILQLISTSAANASTLGTITSQSPAGTLLLKTAPGGAMMTQGQPLLIQLPLSMANGQPGTLVNIPVSSFAGSGNPLNKGKATAPATSTATFFLKAAPSSALTTTTASSSSSSMPVLQACTAPVPRAVYHGGAGGISTPNSGGVSVTSARTPLHTMSVAGAVSSLSSPAASGPAATGSTAPGPPKGTALTSKTDNQATGSTPTKAAVPGSRPRGSVIDLTEDDDDVQVTGVTKKVTTTPSASQRNSLQITIPTARSSPQGTPSAASHPNLTIHHRPQLDSPLKIRSAGTPTSRTAPPSSSSMVLPPLPSAPPLTPRLPPEAQQTSPPQQPQLKLVQGQNGIVLSWCVAETDRNCAAVESYHLYAYHNDHSSSAGSSTATQQQQQQHWKKIGEVKALPLPMACTLTQFQSGSTYHFAVRARDVHGRFGSFCEPQCTNVINSS